MATEIINDKCNGWAVIHKSNLIDDDGRNYHIVEVRIEKGTDGKDYVTDGAKAICYGLKIKPSANFGNCISRKEDQDSFESNWPSGKTKVMSFVEGVSDTSTKIRSKAKQQYSHKCHSERR